MHSLCSRSIDLRSTNMLLLRTFRDICHESPALRGTAQRFASTSSFKSNQSNNIPQEESQQDFGQQSHEKFVYPKRRLKPKVLLHAHSQETHPATRVHNALKYDFERAKNMFLGKPPPLPLDATDILVIGGGIMGSAIAYQLTKRCGPGLNITVIEKDRPALSTSMHIGNNYLYQQVKLKPVMEVAQYAADFYRELQDLHNHSGSPGYDLDFFPNNSLSLGSENEKQYLEEISDVYKELNWSHQILSAGMLKQRFPWMDVEGVSVGCLGMSREGMFNKWKAVQAMREVSENCKTHFLQGEVIGFEFVDQSDHFSNQGEFRQFFSPRRAVIQMPSGDVITRQFGYVIIAAGSSMQDVTEMLNINPEITNIPIQSHETFSYEIFCPDGPGIEMPMIMEPCGLRFRKSDLVNKYAVWEEKGVNEKIGTDKLNIDNYFNEILLPKLVKRVPNFRNAKLLSSTSGIIDSCAWDENVLIGPHPAFYNILVAGGFGNDEFLYAPAVAQGLAEIILDRRYINVDLSCFRLERIEKSIKLNECS